MNAALAVKDSAKVEVGNSMNSCMEKASDEAGYAYCADVETRAVLEEALGETVDNTTLYEYIDNSAASSVVEQVVLRSHLGD